MFALLEGGKWKVASWVLRGIVHWSISPFIGHFICPLVYCLPASLSICEPFCPVTMHESPLPPPGQDDIVFVTLLNSCSTSLHRIILLRASKMCYVSYSVYLHMLLFDRFLQWTDSFFLQSTTFCTSISPQLWAWILIIGKVAENWVRNTAVFHKALILFWRVWKWLFLT